MKKYILIQNDGEIETNAFELIGASTKRDQEGKIGFFGSGLKYSIAYMIRNDISFRVFSGEDELVFSTIPETLRDQTFHRICINGVKTSYTTTMGPTWTEDWFVFREIYCNALDESECQLVKETENINAVSGKTRIYVELTNKLKIIAENWDRYFSLDREPLAEVKNVYTCFLATNKKGGYLSDQKVCVYHKTDGVLYRKGIRVHNNTKLCYDYGVEEADINEDRTASQVNAMSYLVVDLMLRFINEDYVCNILRTGADDVPSMEYHYISVSSYSSFVSDKWVLFSRENLLVVKDISGRYAEEIRESKKEVFYLPSTFARQLKKAHPEILILGIGKSIGSVGLSEIQKTPKMDFLLKEVLASFKEMGYHVHYDISIAQFNSENVLGQADIKGKMIYLSDLVFDKGRREIAMTIIEENEHIASGKEDETRAFQDHLISSWLTSMENKSGLFL